MLFRLSELFFVLAACFLRISYSHAADLDLMDQPFSISNSEIARIAVNFEADFGEQQRRRHLGKSTILKSDAIKFYEDFCTNFEFGVKSTYNNCKKGVKSKNLQTCGYTHTFTRDSNPKFKPKKDQTVFYYNGERLNTEYKTTTKIKCPNRKGDKT